MSSLESTQTFPLEILHASNAFAYSDCSEIVGYAISPIYRRLCITEKTELPNNLLHNYIIVYCDFPLSSF